MHCMRYMYSTMYSVDRGWSVPQQTSLDEILVYPLPNPTLFFFNHMLPCRFRLLVLWSVAAQSYPLVVELFGAFCLNLEALVSGNLDIWISVVDTASR
jgi:hypothetical protein